MLSTNRAYGKSNIHRWLPPMGWRSKEGGQVRPLVALALAAVLGALLLFPGAASPPPVQAAAFVVDSTADDADSVLDGQCWTANQQCTLRAAIQEANGTEAPDIITFNIPGAGPYTIQPQSMMATVYPVIIDGTTQPGYAGSPIIELDGTNSTDGGGLVIAGGNSTVRGLVINRSGVAIRLLGASGNVIEGNYLGTDVSGTVDLGNYSGVFVNDSSNNTIGGTTPQARNLISGNVIGVQINTTSNRLQGNFIGTNGSGTEALGNVEGVWIYNAPGNTIGGGWPPGAGNVISGNSEHGVLITGEYASGNQVQGNLIGTDVTGTVAVGNGNGVVILHAPNNVVGWDPTAGPPAPPNLITGNGNGVFISGSAATGNKVMNNTIGSPGGGTPPGNSAFGVWLQDSASGNEVSRNWMANNGADGVRVDGPATTGNLISMNSIYSNAGKGIENISGGNRELAPPVIVSASMGSVSGTACPLCRVEVFKDEADEGRMPSGWTSADDSGSWTCLGCLGGPWPSNVTATATDQTTLDTSEFSAPFTVVDFDGDGVPNDGDNCPFVPNPQQEDPDDDGIGDACDNCPGTYNPDQANLDWDGLGDVCDPDIDNDLLSNSDETNTWGTDPRNPDSDFDGLIDGDEVANGTSPTNPDTDGDGFLDGVERYLGSNPLVNASRPEHVTVAGTCTDTIDNDLDTLIDAADPGCLGGPPPPDMLINAGAGSTPDGTPQGIRGVPTTVTKAVTAVGVKITVEHIDGVPPVIEGLMTDISGGAGTLWEFTYTPPPREPPTWPTGMTKVTICVNTDDDGQYDDGCQVAGILLIDPSGKVYDVATLTPIAGATVTLERFNPAQSTYVEMDPTIHAGMFSPEVNPETTGDDGRYAWDVAAGTYRVQVQEVGCVAATSSSVTVPPPVTTLDVGLTCSDTDSDGLKDYRETEVGTNPTNPDTDADGPLDGSDNCALVVNPGQENSDSQIGNGKGIAGHDGTVPNSAGDLEGDVCETDGDADNDGIPNASDTDPGGDITYDDNNNGIMCPTDTADDGPSWDSNCDGKLDGWVGACGSGSTDTDTDGLMDAWENCKWGTNPAVIDSDGDTLGDCREAADVDGNAVVNFPGDVIAYAKAAMLAPAAFGRDGDFDIDGNNVINFPGDVIQEAKFGLLTGLCK